MLLRDLQKSKNHNDILAVFSSFRHSGHPFINYKEGLKALFERLCKDRIVDNQYTELLASDLAKKIIMRHFREFKKWPINKTELSPELNIYDSLINNTSLTYQAIRDFGDNWHKLPMTALYEIPSIISPQVMYSDKSHNLDRTEFLEAIRSRKSTTRRVMDTMRKKPQKDYNLFLRDVAENGLSVEALIIGQNAKEKELKEQGRYFALMSWDMREYFVATEYLIKTNFMKYFKGLTMADDQSTLIKKMLDNTSGQGLSNYSHITIANHIDYEKWCNTQSLESTSEIFNVMGSAYGIKELFTQTHNFFNNSWVYYKHRVDLLDVSGDVPKNKDPNIPVFQDGIKGGLEGLRQKGWSIISLLIIEREMSKGPALVKVLAQGDNQVMC